MTKEQVIAHVLEQIRLYELDLEETTEAESSAFFQGQLEAYDDCLAKITEIA